MYQTIIVIVLVALAVLYGAYRLYMSLTGRSPCAGCGSSCAGCDPFGGDRPASDTSPAPDEAAKEGEQAKD